MLLIGHVREAVLADGMKALNRPETWQAFPESMADLDLRPGTSMTHWETIQPITAA